MFNSFENNFFEKKLFSIQNSDDILKKKKSFIIVELSFEYFKIKIHDNYASKLQFEKYFDMCCQTITYKVWEGKNWPENFIYR